METNSLQDMIATMHKKFKDVETQSNNEMIIQVAKSMETNLIEVLTHDVSKSDKREATIMLAGVHLYQGLLQAEMEDCKAGEEQFMKCIKLLDGKELHSKAVLPLLTALNQLGIVWCRWDEPAKAIEFLDRAEQVYNDFVNANKICKSSELLLDMITTKNSGIKQCKTKVSPKDVLEQCHTLTLYYLAQVYRKLKDDHQSVIYLHMTLRKQLGHNSVTQDLDYIDWARNAGLLSVYFIENCIFTPARHHLAAASYILQKYENILKQKSEGKEENEVFNGNWEEFKHTKANIAKYWGKYAIMLLDSSADKILQKTESEDECDQSDNKKSSTLKMIDDLKFYVLEKEILEIENQITDKCFSDFDNARLVFLNAQKWLEQAKAHYTLENYASEHVHIVQDISAAYKFLSCFEKNEDREAKMHKRSVDILENIIKELNPQYYESTCRQIWMELGGTYSAILQIKYNRLQSSNEKPTQQVLAKINHLAKSAIKNYQAFIDSVQPRNSNFKMEQFPDELLRPTLLAYFYIGRLYNKIVTSDKATELANKLNSIKMYKFVVDYCEKYPKAVEVMEVELNLCQELVPLLQKLIEKIELRG